MLPVTMSRFALKKILYLVDHRNKKSQNAILAFISLAPGAGLPSFCSGQAHGFWFGGFGDQRQLLIPAPPPQFFFSLYHIRSGHRAFLIQLRRSPMLAHSI
jgi:hypothetical protein